MMTTIHFTMLMVAFAAVLVGLVFLYYCLRAAGRAYLRFRGDAIVTCPETKKPAGVHVDARRAALSALAGGSALRLKDCSRWPEREGCGQECLSQIEASPADCLVRTILTTWYRDKHCVYCHKPFGDVHWHDHKPAALDPGGQTVEWRSLSTPDLRRVLSDCQPVCWNCHTAEAFRRQFPDRVTDRPWTGEDRHPRMGAEVGTPTFVSKQPSPSERRLR